MGWAMYWEKVEPCDEGIQCKLSSTVFLCSFMKEANLVQEIGVVL